MARSRSLLTCWVTPMAKTSTSLRRMLWAMGTASNSSSHVSSPSVMSTTASASFGSPNVLPTPVSAAAMGVSAAGLGSPAGRPLHTSMAPAPHWSAAGNKRMKTRAVSPTRSQNSPTVSATISQRAPAMELLRSTTSTISGCVQPPAQAPSPQRRPSSQGMRRPVVVQPGASGSGRHGR